MYITANERNRNPHKKAFSFQSSPAVGFTYTFCSDSSGSVFLDALNLIYRTGNLFLVAELWDTTSDAYFFYTLTYSVWTMRDLAAEDLDMLSLIDFFTFDYTSGVICD